MSSRVLRKLQGEEAPGGGDDGKSGREDPEAPGEDTPPLSRGAKPKRPNLNPFELVSPPVLPVVPLLLHPSFSLAAEPRVPVGVGGEGGR